MKGYRLVAHGPKSKELFELRLYRWSPVGPVLTTILIGITVYGLFLLNVWLADGFDTFFSGNQGQTLARVAVILTLILCAALAVSYFDEQASRRDARDLKNEFGLGMPSQRESSPGLRWATLGGFLAGCGFLAFLIWGNTRGDILAFLSSVGLWFTPMTPILWMMMARGVYGSIISGRYMSKLIRDDLTIDLYRHHELATFGRIAMRGAFIWLIFVGIIVLFLTNEGSEVFAQPTLVIAISIAVFNFISTMQPIRRKIRAAKDIELKGIRERLYRARQQMEAGGVGADVPALIALEDRIENIREWPLDLPTAARLPLYLLIPVIPWAAGIYAETLLNRFLGGG